jgi:surface antigen
MGNGYTRQSSADIQTGLIILANPINNEFNSLQAAFDSASGHTHDGTVGEGPKIDITTGLVTSTAPVNASIDYVLGNTNAGVAGKKLVSDFATHEEGMPDWTNPLRYGAVGDGVNDDTAALQAMIASGHQRVDWLGSNYTWTSNTTLNVTDTDVMWIGSATIKSIRTAWCQPLVVIQKTATNFWGCDTLKYDHNAEFVPGATRSNDLALALGVCFLVMADNSHVGGKFYNTFDVGLAFAQIDYTGDGSPGSPYNVTTQYNAHPVNCSFGYVYGFNCGAGEHIVGASTYKQGAALDILTASGVVGQSVIADQCWAGIIVDFASQASASIGSVVCSGTKQDPRAPAASGMGIYNGGFLTIGAYYGSNNAGIDIVCYNTSWVLNIGAATIFASGKQAVSLGGTGWATGKFNIGATGLFGAVPAFQVSTAGAEKILLDVEIMSWGTTGYTYGYYNNGTGTTQGTVKLFDSGAVTAPYFIGSTKEHMRSVDTNGNTTEVNGKFAIGGAVTTASTANLQVKSGQGIDISSSVPSTIAHNLYWDGTNWRYANSTAGFVTTFDPSTGSYTEYTAPAGTAGNIATITGRLIRNTTLLTIGATATSGTSTDTRLEVQGNMFLNSTSPLSVGYNLYWDGTNWRYAKSTFGYLEVFNPNTGVLTEYFAASGTQGNVATLIPVVAKTSSGISITGTLSATSLSLSTALPVSSGGTGSTTASAARTALGLTGVATAATSFNNVFTPVLNFGGGTTGITYVTQAGVYDRIGNLLFISIQLQLSSKGSSTGAANITGIPFNASRTQLLDIPYTTNMTSWGPAKALVFGGTSTLQIGNEASAGTAGYTNANFTNTSEINISGVYAINSLT